jgi:hypothetical protein
MITFTEKPNKTIENLFNNQVFEWNTENGISCEVLITNGLEVRQLFIDGINGYFYIDLKKAIQSLFNIDNFQDVVVPTPITYLIQDYSLFRTYTINFNVTLLNGSIESETIQQNYVKAVDQLTKPLEVENTLFKILTNNILNKRTGISTILTFGNGVNRLFFSHGENTLGFEGLVPLVIGSINQLEFYEGVDLLATIEVYKHGECDAPYLKWFNSRGGWSYFRFSRIFQEGISYKNLDFLNNDFKNIEKTIGNFKTTGKEAVSSLALKTDNMQLQEVDNFIDLYTSPKVFLYTTPTNQPMTRYSFKEVSIANGTEQIKNTKRTVQNFNVTVDLPNFYTQTFV